MKNDKPKELATYEYRWKRPKLDEFTFQLSAILAGSSGGYMTSEYDYTANRQCIDADWAVPFDEVLERFQKFEDHMQKIGAKKTLRGRFWMFGQKSLSSPGPHFSNYKHLKGSFKPAAPEHSQPVLQA